MRGSHWSGHTRKALRTVGLGAAVLFALTLISPPADAAGLLVATLLVIITIATPGSTIVREVFNVCDRAGVKVQIVPALQEILGGEVSISRFRNVGIEDLLGRQPVRLDEEVLRGFLTGRSVLLTGAGGSIGGELARQIARYQPLRLVLVGLPPEGLEVSFQLPDRWPVELDLTEQFYGLPDGSGPPPGLIPDDDWTSHSRLVHRSFLR